MTTTAPIRGKARETPPVLQRFLDKLKGVEDRGGGQYQACCPAHDDNTASLSVSWGDKGKVIVKCHAECDSASILEALHLTWKDLHLTWKDLEQPRKIVATYDYTDEEGVLLYQVVRWEPKSFTQRQPGERKGSWINNMQGVEPVPFNLVAVAEVVEHGTEDDQIWIVEGEKDVLAIAAAWGTDTITATCNHGGDVQWKDGHSEYLSGFRGSVVIVADNDDKDTKPGQKHALSVYESLLRVAGIEAEIVYAPVGKDAADAVSDYGPDDFITVTPDELRAEIAEAARSSTDATATDDDTLSAIRLLFHAEDENRLDVYDSLMSDEDVMALEPPRYVIDGWLPVGFFSDFYGLPGSKKTFVILDMLRCVAAGIPWHGHAVQQGATILFEGEGLDQLQARILAWDEGHEHATLPIPTRWTAEPVNLTTPEGVATVVRTARRYEQAHSVKVVAVGFDPIVEYMVGNEVDGGNELVTRGLRALAQHLNVAVVAGVHTNAAGERARGSDHLRMRSGAHVKVEALPDGSLGLVQDKLKNGQERALILLPQQVGPSLVLDKLEEMSKEEYYSRQASDEREARRVIKAKDRAETTAAKAASARELLLAAVRAQPGIVQSRLLGVCKGKGAGHDALLSELAVLVSEGQIVIDPPVPEGGKAPRHHHINPDYEGGEP